MEACVLSGEEVVPRHFIEPRALYSQQTLSTMDFFAALWITRYTVPFRFWDIFLNLLCFFVDSKHMILVFSSCSEESFVYFYLQQNPAFIRQID